MKREELLKIAKPILFNTEMVKAILEGRKTCTRRVIKLDLGLADTDKNDSNYLKIPDKYGDYHDAKDLCRYKVGDILYVRETWSIQSMSSLGCRVKFLYKVNGKNDLETRHLTQSKYRKLMKYEPRKGWNPSIHMPKEAARIFLKVTEVRIEKLQDITYEQIYEEGIKPYESGQWDCVDYLESFKELWDSTVKKQDLDRYSWRANPWVWVIEFERVEVE